MCRRCRGSVEEVSRRRLLEEYAAWGDAIEATTPQRIRRLVLAPALNLFAGSQARLRCGGTAACLNRLSPSPSASQASRAAKSSARRSTRAQRTTRSASPRCCWVRAPPRPTRRPPADPREPHSAQPPPPRRFARRRRGRAPARDAGLRSRLRVGPRRPLLRAARREPCRRAANRLRRPRRSCCERAAWRRRRSGQRRAAATSLSSTARASRSVDRRSEVGVSGV